LFLRAGRYFGHAAAEGFVADISRKPFQLLSAEETWQPLRFFEHYCRRRAEAIGEAAASVYLRLSEPPHREAPYFRS